MNAKRSFIRPLVPGDEVIRVRIRPLVPGDEVIRVRIRSAKTGERIVDTPVVKQGKALFIAGDGFVNLIPLDLGKVRVRRIK